MIRREHNHTKRIARIAFVFAWLSVWNLITVADDNQGIGSQSLTIQEQEDLANQLLKDGKLDDSVKVLTSILRRNLDTPSRVLVLEKRANLYAALKNYELAVADADAATELAPEDVSPYRVRHACFRALYRYAEAITNGTRVAELLPGHWDVFSSRGMTYQQFGYYKEAIDDFSEAIRLNPTGIGLYDYRGLAAVSAGTYELAEADYTAAIDAGAAGGEKAQSGRYYELGLAQFYLGKHKKAGESFERSAAQRGKTQAEQSALIGSAYEKLLDYPTALTFYDRAVTADPTNVPVLTDRGLTRSEAGDFDGARGDLQRTLQLEKPSDYQYGLRAWLEFVDGKYEQSIEDYETITRVRPNAEAGYYGLGVTYLLLGKRSKALEAFEAGLQHASDEDAQATLSMWYMLSGGTLNDKTRSYVMQFSEQKWPYPLVQYFLGHLDEQAVLRLAKRPDAALARQQECEACFYIGARSIVSGGTHAREYLERAASATNTQWDCRVLARKELEHDFLVSRDERPKEPDPATAKMR